MSFNRPLTGQSQIYATVALNTNVCSNSVSTVYLSATYASFATITTNAWTTGNISTPNVIATNGYFSDLYITTQTVNTLNVSVMNGCNVYASNASVTNLSTSFINASTLRAYITNASTTNTCLVATSTVYSSYNYLDYASIANLSGTLITTPNINASYISAISISPLQTINGATTLRIQNNGGIVVKDRDTSDPALIQLNYASNPSIETYRLYLEANKAYGRIGAGENCSLQFYADTVLQAENTSITGWRLYNTLNTSYRVNVSNLSVSNMSAMNFNVSTFTASNIICSGNTSNFSSNTSYLYAWRGYCSDLNTTDLLTTQGSVVHYGQYSSNNASIYMTQAVLNQNTSNPQMAYRGFRIDEYRFSVSDGSPVLFFNKSGVSAPDSTLYISNISTSNVSTITISSTSIYTSNLSVSNLNGTIVNGTTVNGTTINASSLYASNFIPTNFSTTNMSVVLESASVLNASEIYIKKGNNVYGALVASTGYLNLYAADNASNIEFSIEANTKMIINSNSVSLYSASLYGNKAYFSTMNASFLNTSYFNPASISTATIAVSTLTADTINISTLNPSSISTATINVSTLNASTLNIPSLITSILTASSLTASTITADTIPTINSTSAFITNISVSNASVSGRITTTNICSTAISATGRITGDTIRGQTWIISGGNLSGLDVFGLTMNTCNVYVSLQVNASTGSCRSLTNASTNSSWLNASNASITTVQSTTVNTGTLNASTLSVSTFSPTNISTTNLSVSSTQTVSLIYTSQVIIRKNTTMYGGVASTTGNINFYSDGTNASNLQLSIGANSKMIINSNSVSIYSASLFGNKAYFSTMNASTFSVSTFNPASIATTTIDVSTMNASNFNASNFNPALINTSTINASSGNISNISVSTIIGSTINVSADIVNSAGTFNISVLNCSSTNIITTLPADANFSSVSVSNISITTGITLPNSLVCVSNTSPMILHANSSNIATAGVRVPNYLDGTDLTAGFFIGYNHTGGFINCCRTTRVYGNILTDGNLNTVTDTASLGIGQNITTGNINIGTTTMTGNISINTGGDLIFGCDRRSTFNTSGLIPSSTQLGSYYSQITAVTSNVTIANGDYKYIPRNANTSLTPVPVGLYLVSVNGYIKTNALVNVSAIAYNMGICYGGTYDFTTGTATRIQLQSLGSMNTYNTTNQYWTITCAGVINMSITNQYIGGWSWLNLGTTAATVGSVQHQLSSVTVVKIA